MYSLSRYHVESTIVMSSTEIQGGGVLRPVPEYDENSWMSTGLPSVIMDFILVVNVILACNVGRGIKDLFWLCMGMRKVFKSAVEFVGICLAPKHLLGRCQTFVRVGGLKHVLSKILFFILCVTLKSPLLWSAVWSQVGYGFQIHQNTIMF